MKTEIQVCKDLINLLVGKYNEVDCKDEQGLPHTLRVFISKATLFAYEDSSAAVYFGCKDSEHYYELEYIPSRDTFILFSVDGMSSGPFDL